MNIGKAIADTRKTKGIKQKELSVLTGISATSLSQIEKNVTRPSEETLTKIGKALNIPKEFFYFIAIEESDVPEHKREIYNALYPSLVEMVKKLIEPDDAPDQD